MLIGVSTLATLVACLPLATSIEFLVIGPGFCFWDVSQRDALPISSINVAIILIIFAILLFLTGGICIGVFKMLRRAQGNDTDNTHSQRNVSKTEVNFAKLAIITSLVFGASAIPFTVSMFQVQNLAVVILISIGVDN